MFEVLVGLGGVAAIAFARYAWKKWGKPYFDDPATKEDESDILDPVVDAILLAMDAFIKSKVKEDEEKGRVTNVTGLARQVISKFPGVSLEEAEKRVMLSIKGRF